MISHSVVSIIFAASRFSRRDSLNVKGVQPKSADYSCIYPGRRRAAAQGFDQGSLEQTDKPCAVAEMPGIEMVESYRSPYGWISSM
jgi:hypothetical protein